MNNDLGYVAIVLFDALPLNPHLALCYIKNQDNSNPSEILKYFQEKLIGKTVKFESVNFYLPLGQEKITLIRF